MGVEDIGDGQVFEWHWGSFWAVRSEANVDV